jgi:large subunit ribosomal protein L24
MARHVRKGDLVVVTSGSHKGKTGTILRVVTGEGPDDTRVVIKGLNLRTKHLRPTQKVPQGGIITREAPIHISNVSPVVDGKPTRVRFRTNADGSKVRVSKRVEPWRRTRPSRRAAAARRARRAPSPPARSRPRA